MMKRSTIGRVAGSCSLLFAGVVLGGIVAGCGQGDGPVLARIDARTIHAREFEELYTRQTDDPELTDVEQRAQFLESLVNKELLVLAARERGLFEDPVVIERADQFESGLYRKEYEKRETRIDSTVTDEERRVAFDATAREVLLRHIVHWSRAALDSARQRADAGEDFATVASEVSIAPLAPEEGGLLNWMNEYQLIGPFRDALEGLPVGGVAGPFESLFGIHLIRLEERREREGADFEVEGEGLTEQVVQIRQRAAQMAMQDALLTRYGLQVDKAAVVATVNAAKVALERVAVDSTGTPATDVGSAGERWQLEPAELEQVLATYDGGQITVADYQTTLLGRGFFINQRLNPGAALQDVRSIFYSRAMLEDARRLGLDRVDEIRHKISIKREEVAVTELYNREILAGIEVTDADAKQFHDENADFFTKEARVRYAYLKVDDASVAEALVGELSEVTWTRFDSLQTELADTGQLIDSKRDTGFIGAGRLPPDFVATAGEMEARQVGHVVWPDGSHVTFVLIEYQPARPLSFDESSAAAINSVRAQRSEERLNALLDELRATYAIEVFPERLAPTGG